MRIVSIVGARPQFVKLAPMARALGEADIDHVIVHTGQHYDTNMSDVFFADLAIPDPDINLEVGSGSHGIQTGAMLAALDPVLGDLRPDWVMVYGDTNSTLAGTLSAVKLHLPVAHLEAGLRSFNRAMPEEHNRVLTDHAADLLLAPTETAVAHLNREGLRDRTIFVGDVMADICLLVKASIAGKPIPAAAGSVESGGFLVATLHRAENTDDPLRLEQILRALRGLPMPVLLLTHPRLRDRAADYGISLAGGSVRCLDPLPYPAMVNLVSNAMGVVTDSGGLQKEAFLLGTLCTTVRTETEWLETLEGGWNVLATDPSELPRLVLRDRPVPPSEPFGDGNAASAVVAALIAQRSDR